MLYVSRTDDLHPYKMPNKDTHNNSSDNSEVVTKFLT